MPLRRSRPLSVTHGSAGVRTASGLRTAIVAAFAALCIACGSAPDGRLVDAGRLPDGAPLTIPVDAGYNATDVNEALRLVERHEQRRPLLELIVREGTDPETREVARRVLADAEAGDGVALALLERWGQPQRTEIGRNTDLEVGLLRLAAAPVEAFDAEALALLLPELQADVVDGAIARNDGRDDDARRLGNDTAERAQRRILRVRDLLGQ